MLSLGAILWDSVLSKNDHDTSKEPTPKYPAIFAKASSCINWYNVYILMLSCLYVHGIVSHLCCCFLYTANGGHKIRYCFVHELESMSLIKGTYVVYQTCICDASHDKGSSDIFGQCSSTAIAQSKPSLSHTSQKTPLNKNVDMANHSTSLYLFSSFFSIYWSEVVF